MRRRKVADFARIGRGQMSRYFITTVSERREAFDDEGLELRDTLALEKMMRDTLACMAREEEGADFSAYATDAEGRLVTAMTLSIAVGHSQRRVD